MLTTPSRRQAALVAAAVVAVTLAAPSSALAAGPHPVIAQASILGSIFGGIGHAVLGAFTWTVKLASTFILDTIGALVKLLIPRSWAHEGAEIMGWIVAVPDYAGHVTTPGGHHEYGFAGINNLRSLFMWLGMALAPLTLTHATARAMVGDQEADPIGIPLLRIVLAGALILLYPYLWAQGAALADQITHVILSLPDVTSGLQKLMDYAVDGVALGGWQLIDLGLMGAIAIELLGLIFLKVVLILVGALLYATGPLTIGLVPTRFGHAVARAWVSAVIFLLTIGVAWATIFAVGALLIEDSGTAGPLIGGNSAFGGLVGGLVLAVCGLVSLWLCLKVAKEAGGILRMQLGGLFALTAITGGSSSSVRSSAAGRTTVSSLRSFGSRLSTGARGAGTELAAVSPGGRQARLTLAGAGYVGRRGLVGTAAAGARYAGSQAAAPAAALIGRTRAGAVAVRMAKAGTAGYSSAAAGGAGDQTANGAGRDTVTASRRAAGNGGGAQAASTSRRSRKPRPSTARGQSQPSGNARSAPAASNAIAGPDGQGDATRQSRDRAAARIDAPISDRGSRPDSGTRGRPSSNASGARTPRPTTAPSTAATPARSSEPTSGGGRGSRDSTPPPATRTTRPSQPPARAAKSSSQAPNVEQRQTETDRQSRPIKTTQPPPAPRPNRQPPPPTQTPDGSRQ